MKRFLYYCPECKKVTLMSLVKEDKNTNTVFLKCVVCSASGAKSTSKKAPEEKKKSIKEYNPKESYQIGDSLYHKIFKDTGEVIKITKRVNGQIINTVLFPKAGIKKLITLAGSK